MPSNHTHVISTQGMSCQHCVKAVTQAIQRQDPQAQVSVDLAKGEVSVSSSLAREHLVRSIEEEGYQAT